MKKSQLEAWILDIVSRVTGGQSLEDDRVELKSVWIDPVKAARRIGGHANAARGEPVLWIIGIDEERGTVVHSPSEPDRDAWWRQVEREFDGIAPDPQFLFVPTGSGSVVGILFDTSRAPYVVRNRGDGPVDLEVPWRSGTGTRSARREHLIRILTPLNRQPRIEVITAELSVFKQQAANRPLPDGVPRLPGGPISTVRRTDHLAWSIRLSVYVTPPTQHRLTLPHHQMQLSFRVGKHNEPKVCEGIRCVPNVKARQSAPIYSTSSEAICNGPGLLEVWSDYYEPVRDIPDFEREAWATLAVAEAGQDRSVVESCRLCRPDGPSPISEGRWLGPS